MDQIRIDNLEVYAYHGVFPEENEKGQPFFINAVLYTETRKAGKNDDLSYSTHYGEVSLLLHKVVKENVFQLIETVAEKAAEEVLLAFPLIRRIDLEIRKPEAPIPLPFESVSVKITRGWKSAYVAFGSNLGDSHQIIDDAIEQLRKDVQIRVLKISNRIITTPYGGVEQNDFVNGVVKLETLYTPEELLECLHTIEQSAGRTREIHWGPRTLDLDIILFEDLVLLNEDLIIPHLDMCNRDFVLGPLAEIDPYVMHPVYHKCALELLQNVKEKHIL